MRAKRLPPAPADVGAVWRARDAVSRVPDPVADCCARVSAAVDCDRRAARDWLTLLRGLSLVERTPDGYRRTAVDDDRSVDLRGRALDGVYGAREAHAALDETPRSVDAVAEAVPQPTWERRRAVDPARAWRDHVERLLDWLTLVGAAERVEDRYRSAGGAATTGGRPRPSEGDS